MAEVEAKIDTAGTAGAAPGKSRGQAVLERLVGQVGRLGRIRQQLELVHAQIAPLEGAPVTSPPAPSLPAAPAASFFELLEWICDHGDLALDQLEQQLINVEDDFSLTFHVKAVL